MKKLNNQKKFSKIDSEIKSINLSKSEPETNFFGVKSYLHQFYEQVSVNDSTKEEEKEEHEETR